jgi:predicted phage terminase large subunit-like protein
MTMKLIDFCQGVWPRSYQLTWHLNLIAKHLEKTLLEGGNLMLFCPPRHGKSEMCTVFGPAFALGLDPLLHFMAITNSGDLARKSSLKCRDLITSPEFQSRFPHGLGVARESSWTLRVPGQDGNFSYLADGVGGQITGHGCDVLVVDDTLKSLPEAYSSTIRDKVWSLYSSAAFTRLSPQGRQIVLQARFHSEDLPGKLLKLAQADAKAAQWTVVVLAATNVDGSDSYILDTSTGAKQAIAPYEALWPARYPAEALRQIRATIGDPLWTALYQQRPSLGEAQIFKPECFGTYEDLNVARVICAWDTASRVEDGNAYSVGVTLAQTPEGNFQLLDVVRVRQEFGDLARTVVETMRRAYATTKIIPDACVIEAASSGIALIQELSGDLPVAEIKPKGSKIVRAEGVSGVVSSGRVSLPREVPWKDVFLKELSEFPLAEFADQVDAFVHALSWFSRPAEFQHLRYDATVIYDPREEYEDWKYERERDRGFGGDF